MARLRIIIEQEEGEKQTMIKIIFSGLESKEIIIESLKSRFEIEMMTAEIKTKSDETTIIIKTENQEKVESFRRGMKKVFRDVAGLGKINLN